MKKDVVTLSIDKDSKTKSFIQVGVKQIKLQYNYLAQHFIRVATKNPLQINPHSSMHPRITKCLFGTKIVLHLSVVHSSEQFHTSYNK